MITEFKAVCPRTGQTAAFVRDEPREAYLCTCTECGTRDHCRSAVTDEMLANSPDGDVKVQLCYCSPTWSRR